MATAEFDQIKKDIADLREDLVSFMKASKADGENRLGEIKNHFVETTRRLGGEAEARLRDAYVELSSHGKHAVESAKGQVRAHPATSIALAFVAGALWHALHRRNGQ